MVRQEPRELAYDVLRNWQPQGRPATTDLDARLRDAELSPSARGLTTELVHGVIRRRATLDALLAPHSRRPLRQIEPELRVLLHLGIYQLAFLSGAPVYAMVDETVELAKRFRHPEWAGFVNALLRAVSGSLSDETLDHPGADALPLAGGAYRRLSRNCFPDPARDAGGYLAAAFSFPAWLVARWSDRYPVDELLRLGFWFNAPPILTLRANLLRTTREQMLQALHEAGVAAQALAHPEGVALKASAPVAALPGFADGWFAVQDESAMHAASLLAPRPGERVLDLCAAPGGKTAHLAACMQNSGSIVACDVSVERLRRVDENCRRLGATIVETQSISRDGTELPAGPFDAALVDAPCSNTGVLARRPEARWRLKPADIEELAALQRRLLQSALSRLRPGGRVVYSTCSIEPEENERVVASILTNAVVRLVAEHQHIPGRPGDGGYQALVQATGSGDAQETVAI